MEAPSGLRRVASPALAGAGATQQLAQRNPLQGAIGDDAIIGPVIGDAVDATTLNDADERLAGLTTARLMEFRGVEVGEPDLYPGRPVCRRPNAKTIAIPDIAHRTLKTGPMMRQGGSAGIGVRRAGGNKDGRPERQGGRFEKVR
jgi:hypothetical protein